MKMVVKHKDLKEIVEAIKQNFDKAATDGDQVSEMLEISSGTFEWFGLAFTLILL